MKWLIVTGPHSSIGKFLAGAELGEGTPGPARFLRFLLDRQETVHLVTAAPDDSLAPSVSCLPNFALHAVPYRKSWGRTANVLLLLRTVSGLCRSRRPDLIYCTGYDAIPCAIIARREGIRCFSRFYGTFLLQLFEPGNWVKRRILKLAAEALAFKLSKDGLVISDDGTRGDRVCDRLHIPRAKVLFLRNGVDKKAISRLSVGSDREATRARLGVPRDAFLITSVSRLSSWKRVDLVTSAFAEYVSRSRLGKKKLALLIIGSGSQERALRSQAALLPCHAQIQFLGSLSQEDTWRIMACSDLIPSFYEVSNVGNVLLEALELGKCVVARATGGTEDVITHARNGFLVPIRERAAIDGFCDVVEELRREPQRAKQVSMEAKRWAHENLTDWHDRFTAEYEWVSERVTRNTGKKRVRVLHGQ